MLGYWQDVIAYSNPSAVSLRLALAKEFAITTALAEICSVIASQPVSVARVLSRRNAGKLSWRRAAFKRRDEVEFVDWTGHL